MNRKFLGLNLFLLGCVLLASFFVVMPALAQGDPIVLPYGAEAVEDVQAINWMLWVQTGILIAIFGVVLYFGITRNGDKGAAIAIEQFGADRENVLTLERAYQESPQKIRLAFDSVTEFVWFAKNLTVLESPDSLARLMKDIQVPGPPMPQETVSQGALNEATPSS
jgi:hypothetical protein